MPISKTHDSKSPTQNPVAFYKSEQFGGAPGGTKQQSIPQELKGGPMKEKIMGNAKLHKQ